MTFKDFNIVETDPDAFEKHAIREREGVYLSEIYAAVGKAGEALSELAVLLKRIDGK